jgi:hypothetical protein
VARLLLGQVAPNVSSGIARRLRLQTLTLHGGSEHQTLHHQLLDTIRQRTRAVLNIRPKVIAPERILPDRPFQRIEKEIEAGKPLLRVQRAQSL